QTTSGPLVLAHPAHTGPQVGVQVLSLWSDWDQHTAIFDKLAAAHVPWVRLDIGWSSLEYDGSGQIAAWYEQRLDTLIDEATTRHIKVLGLIKGLPAWNALTATSSDPALFASQFAEVSGWLAARYKGRVAAWELWNDPDEQ